MLILFWPILQLSTGHLAVMMPVSPLWPIQMSVLHLKLLPSLLEEHSILLAISVALQLQRGGLFCSVSPGGHGTRVTFTTIGT